jgi:hypothetical protein
VPRNAAVELQMKARMRSRFVRRIIVSFLHSWFPVLCPTNQARPVFRWFSFAFSFQFFSYLAAVFAEEVTRPL